MKGITPSRPKITYNVPLSGLNFGLSNLGHKDTTNTIEQQVEISVKYRIIHAIKLYNKMENTSFLRTIEAVINDWNITSSY